MAARVIINAMITGELQAYILKAREVKISDEEIKKTLLAAGWDETEVQKALVDNQPAIPVPVPPTSASQTPKTTQQQTSYSMWDAFEHILLFISLFVFTVALGQSIHTYLDAKFIPLVVTDYYRDYGLAVGAAMYSVNMYLLRWYIAALLVSYPFFSFLFLNITKRTKENPKLRQLTARKVLIYATLVLTFLLLFVNVLKIVVQFLGGNITVNLLAHFLVTVTISGIIAVYYVLQVREDRKIHA